MLRGNFSRKWKCLGGFKFVYVNAAGGVQWCSQQRAKMMPLDTLTPAGLQSNNHHKPCEAGCSLGCVRMISHTLGEPIKTMGASVKLAVGMSQKKTNACVPAPAAAGR